MPKILAPIVFSLCVTLICSGNTATYDSLEYLLHTEEDDVQRMELYYQLSNELMEYKPKRAFDYATQLYELGELNNNLDFTIQGLLLQCDFYTLIGEYSKAFELAYQALNLAQTDKDLMSNCHNRIANIHSSLSNFKESLYHNKKALQYNSELKDSAAIMLDIHNIAVDYTDLKLYDSALKYLNKTNEYEIKRTGMPDSYSLSNIGNVYLRKNKLDSALVYHNLAYEYDLKNQSTYLLSLDEQFLATTHFKMGNFEEAQKFALKSIKGALKTNAHHIALDNYKILSRIKESEGNFELAYQYANQYSTLRDSILRESKQAIILKLENEYQLDAQKKQLSSVIRQKSLYRLTAIISALFVISLAIIIFLVYRRQTAYRKLVEELQLSDNSKERMLSIISHDLRGSVGALRTASKAIADGATDLDGTRELMASFFPVSDSIYDLLENLLIWAKCNKEIITPVIEDLNIRELIEKTVEHTYHLAYCKNIEVINNVMAVYIRGDRNMMLSVIRNLLSNAIKFSYAKSRVTLNQEITADELILSIQDEGIGIEENSLIKLFTTPEEVQASGTVGERGSGLGLNICKTFIESQGGRIWAESKPGWGTTFFISIPLTK